jgi:hypothetical protein
MAWIALLCFHLEFPPHEQLQSWELQLQRSSLALVMLQLQEQGQPCLSPAPEGRDALSWQGQGLARSFHS